MNFLSILAGNTADRVSIYGDGRQTRDWLYVKDTANALVKMFESGARGHTYNLGAHQFRTVIDVVRSIGERVGLDWPKHVDHIADRIRGDRRYALDLNKTSETLGWVAETSFETGLKETVDWYTNRESRQRLRNK